MTTLSVGVAQTSSAIALKVGGSPRFGSLPSTTWPKSTAPFAVSGPYTCGVPSGTCLHGWPLVSKRTAMSFGPKRMPLLIELDLLGSGDLTGGAPPCKGSTGAMEHEAAS